jgi:hypothetical protein
MAAPPHRRQTVARADQSSRLNRFFELLDSGVGVNLEDLTQAALEYNVASLLKANGLKPLTGIDNDGYKLYVLSPRKTNEVVRS